MSETIIAQATAKMPSAIAIVRMSGIKATEIAQKICCQTNWSNLSNNRVLAYLYDENGKQFEQALILIFKTPNSFTGEDIIEFHCHGNNLICDKLIKTALFYGARLALPGEFTQRAFLNRKLDLIQAEAIMDLIQARSEKLLKAASSQLNGNLSQKINLLIQKLFDIMGLIHGPLDFPMETEFLEIDLTLIENLLEEIKIELQGLIKKAKQINIYRQGLKTLILGRPNVGKSSLLNALLQEDRAIVSSTAGTTRDFISESLSIADIPLNLIDTAGLRNEKFIKDDLEKKGIEKAKSLMKEAELIFFVFDSGEGWTMEDQNLFAQIQAEKLKETPIILIGNKIDLLNNAQQEVLKTELENMPDLILISAQAQTGFLDLEKTIIKLFQLPSSSIEGDFEIAINQRQSLCLQKAENILKTINLNLPTEIISTLTQEIIQVLQEINGSQTYSSDTAMQSIFANFCIGK